MGLGHFGGGVSAARWLARQGAEVTVTDRADEHALADSLAALCDEPIARFHLGGHREADFRHTDLVVVNPAVRPGSRFLEIARDSGACLTSEIELFLDACPARIVGVTGSNGKSTTAAMTAAILEADGRRTWLGGNIGTSLLDRLDHIGPDDWVVLELSSFQLWHLSQGVRMPEVAVVTNCSPNHLDWHQSYTHYRAAKQRILTAQDAEDLAVLNTLDAEVAAWGRLVRGRQAPLVAADEVPPVAVPGEHNRRNALCAATAAAAVGCGAEAVLEGLAAFSTLPQRLQPIGEIEGRRLYNDSSSTTPDSTVAGLRALEGPTWLLAGGSDKGIDFGALAAAIAERACGAAFYGAVRNELRRQVVARAPSLPCTAVETMRDALSWCWHRSRPGDSIVLSPACASHDQFQNFRQRGEKFVELIRTWTAPSDG
ncbi:MAG TPA: UDP-N-acetylmuramoyl-L-alanine--D-glutamate ligase [Thermoguttaceae bacterium]|nr:UDP-N-acetylmuramoyl-L-alanine--D-glutamate ligase [Thermoguttaceae bacterium]